MLALTAKDLLQHRASWHDEATAEGARINHHHAVTLGRDVAATFDRLMLEAVRQKLGSIPPADQFRFRLVDIVDPIDPSIRWLHLDEELIAVHTVPTTKLEGTRYVVSWYWKNLVNLAHN